MKLFDKHHGTERFFIMIFACIIALGAIFGYAGKINADRNKHTIASTALYTGGYKWSRTSATGHVVSLISNNERTKVFMLIKNDMFTSFDARDYEVFMTGTDGKIESNPSLTIYSYGATGYVGFYFTNAKGFDNQVLNMYIRNDSAASDMATENTYDPNAVKDKSFRDHNQIQILANFGASGMQVSSAFDGANVNQIKLFTETAGVLPDGTNVYEVFNGACGDARAALDAMSDVKLRINQYAENLDQMAIVVPELPYYIKTDIVNTTPNDFTKEPVKFVEEMAEGDNSASSGTNFLGETEIANKDTGNVMADNTEGEGAGTGKVDQNGVKYNYYHVEYMWPGAIHLDWQDKILSDGFITQTSFYKDMTDPDVRKAYEKYLEWRSESKDMYDSLMPSYVSYDAWRKKDGSYVDMADTNMTGEPRIINEYVKAVNEYLSLKRKYFDAMHRILEVEAKVQLIGQNTTIFVDSEERHTLWLY